jgi:2-succinyl-6-hydroxy-2,4-cyclohexadiene-1-carboxylate synthase
MILLHGFAGTRRAWDGVIARLPPDVETVALDLPGHGAKAGARRPISFEDCVDDVLAQAPESFCLCGYSLGGRIALHVALAAPERVTRLVLVSSTAGIEEESERAQRREADERLAEELEGEPFEEFIERWRSQPLFAGEPSAAAERAREDHRRNRPEALAAVLRGLGSGAMESLWKRLPELQMPVDVVVGERDMKYRELGRRMLELLPSAQLVVAPGGHGLPLENPAAVAGVLARPHEEPL